VINSGVELGSLVSRSFAQSRAEPLAQPMLNSTDADSTDSEIAKIIVTQAVPRPMDEAIPLGVSVRNSGDGDLLTIGGLVKGTMLSAGRAVGDNGWWLFATGLNNAVIRPPPHFVGAMEVAVELRLADTAFIDRRTLRFEWVKAEIPQVELKSEAQEAQPKTQPIHQLASEEIAALLKRGNDLISKGDLAAARLVLRRAAEAGDVHAAIALASTYDPMYLEKLELHGFSPDLAVARLWYEKAKELGSSDASKRLNMLAGRPN
jgi:TPR repeat protein